MTFEPRDPTPKELASPLFEAIWQTIKTWDINAPWYSGYCGATGNHAAVILRALTAALSGSPQVEAGTVAWLVESFAGRPACYLENLEWVSRLGTMGHDPVWTADHMKALRFSRQADAEKIAAALDPTDTAKATEHKWIGALVKRGLDTEQAIIAAKAREWAEHYDQSSDGRNTFILFAEWVESRPREQEGGEAMASVAHDMLHLLVWVHETWRIKFPGPAEVLREQVDALAERYGEAHPAPLPADGWALVPVEPTAEMLMRGQHFYDKTSCGLVDGEDPMAEAWARMLAAAPTPPASTEGGADGN